MSLSVKLERLMKVLLFSWLVLALYFQHNVGLADNGDFVRTMTLFTPGPAGIEPNWPAAGTEDWSRRFFNFWLPYWKFDWSVSRPVTSAVILWLPGVLLNYVLYSRTVLAMQALSLVPKALLLAFFGLLFKWVELSRFRPRWLLYLTLLLPVALLLTTTEYLAYFNSFYQEAASFVYLFLFLASLVFLNQRKQSGLRLALCVMAVLLLTTAKMSNIYWPFVALPAVLFAVNPDRSLTRFVKVLAPAGLGLALLLAAVCVFVTRPGALKHYPYHSLFFGVLTLSDDPAARLNELGLGDAAYCVGESSFLPPGPECLVKYAEKMSYWNTMRVLYREPVILFRIVHFAAGTMQDTEVIYLSKYSSLDPKSQMRLAALAGVAQPAADDAAGTPLNLWATLKSRFFPRGYGLLFTLLLFAGSFLFGLRRQDRFQDVALIGLLAVVASFTDMIIAFLGDGRQELVKHLFLSNVLFDIAGIAFLSLALAVCVEQVRTRLSQKAVNSQTAVAACP